MVIKRGSVRGMNREEESDKEKDTKRNEARKQSVRKVGRVDR